MEATDTTDELTAPYNSIGDSVACLEEGKKMDGNNNTYSWEDPREDNNKDALDVCFDEMGLTSDESARAYLRGETIDLIRLVAFTILLFVLKKCGAFPDKEED